ncbi:MAG TPA: NADH-quinone oxidoreductase subunit J [Pyrinomonadaceae bacterium]|jgi:NADH-quinone oxidoreductase subunit J|nr:NADH-quinone oxidoreductase subunit J [Pyrinomonadaceae bacterium]
MFTIPLFILFGAMAVGCALAMVAQRNPLYSAISLIGVFVSLACLYMTLQAPFIAAVQVIVYAGAIMVLVVFVIMLLNVEEEVRRPVRLHFLIPLGILLAAILIGEAAFILKLPGTPSRIDAYGQRPSDVGLTASIGTGLFTEYLLPFEVTSVLILMALVGAITLARRTATPRLAAPGNITTEPPELGPRGEVVIRPGDTAATGRAFARHQIEHGEAAGPAKNAGEEGAR